MERFPQRLNQPPDPRLDFSMEDSFHFLADRMESFDIKTGEGLMAWQRHRRKPRVAFSHMTMPLEETDSWEFPPVFDEPKLTPFKIDFVSDRCVRLRWHSRKAAFADDSQSLMLDGPVAKSKDWKFSESSNTCLWKGPQATLSMIHKPWRMVLTDNAGKEIWSTHHIKDGKCMIVGRPQPFSFVRRSRDMGHTMAAALDLKPGEKIFGCGESFTALNKRGQVVNIATQDAHGTQTGEMYKPVPFYMSSRGYGAFVHASTPMTFDFGEAYDDSLVLYNGDESLDLFLFVGSPAEILTGYTVLTGRSPSPPLWSFGLWMSRITYESEKETREVAANLKKHRIPCDLIHLDTGWFETDWCCDYEFSPKRFEDAKKMIADLDKDGYKICLWQLPYFTPKNRLYSEIIDKKLFVPGPGGHLPSEEVALDFSNPETIQWYKDKLKGLLKQGVGAIKVDFGEAAPYVGEYASGKSGWWEHNLYPLRYNKAAAEAVTETHDYHLIWARSAWAGSQRYPLHWGGDAEASNGGMLGSLRGGLSFGLSGFSFWANDVGGFFPATPKDLYLRWLPFGLMNSHSRCHGIPPTEPWLFEDDNFLNAFRKAVEFRYRLIPYLWAQAADCSAKGHPMIRPLFFEFPNDEGSWRVEDEFLLGRDILVAPLLEEVKSRQVYLPPGEWVDLQSRQSYSGGRFYNIEAGEIAMVCLARAGSAIPTLEPALNTRAQDWSKVTVWSMGADAKGLFRKKDDDEAKAFEVREGKVSEKWNVEVWS